MGDMMVSQDVMTPLSSLLFSYSQWSPGQESDTACNTLIQALDLLWNLVEASNTALNIFNCSGLLDIVLRYNTTPSVPPALLQSSLTTLAAVSDSNSSVSEVLLARQEELLLQIKEPASLLSRVTVAVILLNIHGSNIYSSPSILALVLETITLCLAQDSKPLLSSYSSREIKVEEEMDVGEEEEGSLETADRNILEIIRSQTTALEVLVNLGNLDDENDWVDEDSENSEDEEQQDAEGMSEGERERRLEINPMFVEMVVGKGLLTRVLDMVNDTTEEVKTRLKKTREGRNLVSQHQALRTRAFLCLANLTEILSVSDLGGVQSLHQTWTNLGALCFTTQVISDDLLEAATSAMRATTQKICAEPEGRDIFHINDSDIQSIISLYSRATQASIRTNIVHIVGETASMAARLPGDTLCEQVLGSLAVWLVETAAKDQDLVVCGEALDKFIDVFTEDSSDLLFARLGLLGKLKHTLGTFKTRLEQHRATLDQAYPILHQARSNLQRFIKYKQKRPIIAAANKS